MDVRVNRRRWAWGVTLLVALQAGDLPAAATAVAGGPAEAARVGESSPGGGSGTALLRLTLFRPGTVWLDGAPVLDLTGATQRAPRPWQESVLKSTEIPAGTHRLALRPVDPRLVPPFDEVTITVAAGDTADVALGRPLLITSPPGARVRHAGQELGVTPLRLDPRRLPDGPLVIERAGCVPDTLPADSLLARTRESGSLRLEMLPLPGAVAMGRTQPPRRRYLGFSRWQAVGVSTALVAGGVASALALKSAADDRYQVYRRTGDPARQRTNFDAAQRYDRLSLIGWAVAEAAFVSAFFLIIQEEPKGLVPTATAGRDPRTGEPAWQVGVRRAF